MTQELEIGRLLRAGTSGFVVGCRVSQLDAPAFGGLVRVPLGDGYQVYGLIYDIRIDDDGLVRQLITAEEVDPAIIADNRVNRNIPIEMSVLSVGHRYPDGVRHLLPPRPPLSLDMIYLCSLAELYEFTSAGFGYFRHILRAKDVPVGEMLAAHVGQASEAHRAAGNVGWAEGATKELIVLLRDDYPTLMAVLSALGDAIEIH
ncbi:MAG: hypothetical protein ACE5GO_11820 [Anaerolineales bacterium]